MSLSSKNKKKHSSRNGEGQIPERSQRTQYKVNSINDWLLNSNACMYDTLKLSNHNSIVSEKYKLQKHMERYIRELKYQNQELKKVTDLIVHKTLEPIRNIEEWTKHINLKRGKFESESNEYIKYLGDSANTLNKLINDLYEFSKIQKLRVSKKEISLKQLVETVKLLLGNKIPTNASISYENPVKIIEVKIPLLTKILGELVHNAIKFNENDSPLVSIKLIETKSNFLFQVSDNGIGIARPYQSAIFEICRKLHVESEYEGSGVGLATCKKLIEKEGGKIWLNSQPNIGSIFYFEIPK